MDNYVNFYEGHLLDEANNSLVRGMIIDGSFFGTIESKKFGKYFLEPSKRYGLTPLPDAIIYNENDLNFNNTYLKQIFASQNQNEDAAAYSVGCGSNNKTIQTLMANERNSMKSKNQSSVSFEYWVYVLDSILI